MSVILDQAEGC